MDVYFSCFQRLFVIALLFAIPSNAYAQSQAQLKAWLKRFPQADLNKDGKLSYQEANIFRAKMQAGRGSNRGAPREFKVDAGWDADKFPSHAICYLSPSEIAAAYERVKKNGPTVTSYPKPEDGSLRIVGTGHSFMAPGYGTFPKIAAAAGLKQPPLLTHTGGGITGSTRYKWEQENGIFQFDKRPNPKLLASIANAEWDAMMWGPYFNDRPQYYSCWIEFCLKYNPEMKFYLSDAWPQLDQLDELPKSEKELTTELFQRLRDERFKTTSEMVNELNAKYDNRVYVMPTSAAMTLAVKYFHEGKLPGIEGVHKLIGGKERSLWRDRLGHLGPGLGDLEGYVFYATIYGRSPEEIQGRPYEPSGKKGFPSKELDAAFRKIAWEAVLMNPLSGVKSSR